jgi:hypothetical protein
MVKKKITKLKPVLNNHIVDPPSQFKVPESVERDRKVKPSDVFDGLKKEKVKKKKKV